MKELNVLILNTHERIEEKISSELSKKGIKNKVIELFPNDIETIDKLILLPKNYMSAFDKNYLKPIEEELTKEEYSLILGNSQFTAINGDFRGKNLLSYIQKNIQPNIKTYSYYRYSKVLSNYEREILYEFPTSVFHQLRAQPYEKAEQAKEIANTIVELHEKKVLG